jgi:hypothetical protein
MRIRVNFGVVEKKDVDWWKPLDHFPKLFKYKGMNYEFVFYDKDPTGVFDMILTCTQLPSYDPNYDVVCETWEQLFGEEKQSGCQCGAAHTSFSNGHMFYCSKWRKF